MNRRTFLKSSVAAAVTASAISRAPGEKPARKPNVLFAFSDQQRAVSLQGEPFSSVVAPNLDNFRRRNFSMEQCISNYPLCAPYRGMLISGRWPHQTGVTHNGAHLAPTETTLGHVFGDAGYHTGYVGKWHLNGEDDVTSTFIPKGPLRMGFDDWHMWSMTNNHYHSWTYDQDTGAKISPEGWNATRMTDEAVTFIEGQPAGRPWFLMVSWNPPHHPYNPPDTDADLYPTSDLKLRPNVRFSLAGHPATGTDRALTSDEALRTQMRGYFGGISGIDAEFQRLLDALEKTGQAENTIVVFTSDHGEMIGSHGRTGKSVPFEESCHVPFFVRYPGVTAQQASSDALFAAVDIYPTVCGLAGIPAPAHCAGRDFSALMKGLECKPSEMIFLLNQPGGGEGEQPQAPQPVRVRPVESPDSALLRSVHPPTYRAVRTTTHTYAVTPQGRWFLFDNAADPYQLRNLVNQEDQLALMDSFDRALRNWMKSTGDNFQLPQPANRIAELPA